ncbi:hypothetical protein D0N87_34540, partial [Pseudomonas sp. ATCC 13867]
LPATRPHNSRLDTRKLRETFGLTLPAWETHMKRMLIELAGENPHEAEGHHPRRRRRHPAASRHALSVQAVVAGLRQTDGLLP